MKMYDVSEPVTEIIGAPDLYIDRGSTINLTCVVTYSPEPPAYIFWNHNDAVSVKRFRFTSCASKISDLAYFFTVLK
jgi:hypothetical protein